MEKIKFVLVRGNQKIKDEVLSCKRDNEKMLFFVDGIKLCIFLNEELAFIRETKEDVLTIKNDYAHVMLKDHNFETLIPIDKSKLIKEDNKILIDYKFCDDESVQIKIDLLD